MEKLTRKYPGLITPIQLCLTLTLYIQCAIIIGISMFPSVYAVYAYWQGTVAWPIVLRLFVLSIVVSLAFFLYCVVVIFVVPFFRWLMRLNIQEGRYYYFSWPAIQWATYNSLILIVRYTCINFLRVTPLIVLFHRMMGAKIGRNVQINTAIIGDSCLLEIGDNTAVGGDVTLVAHLAEHNELVVKKVKIGKNCTLGIMAIIVPGVEIGDGVMVAAGTVFKKDTVAPSHTVWAGVPARQLGPLNPSSF
ncbi:MAG: hypothetical protein A3B70_02865 [Deltaproteobacteria bacterium RIFCSPHIGHO2_02_FULL_40_11]|nr:MAG: hypothetical protein A3B70_02865 [Deltaproteobacteria bacterium RIFCSPHIGHO2_02_FULL_40_11]